MLGFLPCIDFLFADSNIPDAQFNCIHLVRAMSKLLPEWLPQVGRCTARRAGCMYRWLPRVG